MKYKGFMRISLNETDFCFVDMRQKQIRQSYYREFWEILTDSKGEILTLKKANFMNNRYIDFDEKEEGFKLPYMDDLRAEGFIDCFILALERRGA